MIILPSYDNFKLSESYLKYLINFTGLYWKPLRPRNQDIYELCILI